MARGSRVCSSNALVIVTADHGEALVPARQARGPRRPRAGGPARAADRAPSGRAQRRHARGGGAHLGDIVPTVLDVAGLPARSGRCRGALAASARCRAERVITAPTCPRSSWCAGRRRSIRQQGPSARSASTSSTTRRSSRSTAAPRTQPSTELARPGRSPRPRPTCRRARSGAIPPDGTRGAARARLRGR